MNLKKAASAFFFILTITSTLTFSMSSQSSRMQTRPANADQHPGQVVVKRKRRTKAEMDAARTEERASQDEKEKLKAELMKNIARLEDELAQKDAKDRAGQERPRPRPKAV